MNKCILFLLIYCLPGTGFLLAQPGFQASYKPYRSQSWVQDKAFYLLTAMNQMPGLRNLLLNQPDLRQLGRQKRQQLMNAVQTGSEESAAYVDAARWGTEEIKRVGQALIRVYSREPMMRMLVQRHLRPCGYYERWATLPDTSLLKQAWEQAAAGLNQVLAVYGLGRQPRYPAIDSVSYDPTSLSYRKLIRITASVVSSSPDSTNQLFWAPTLEVALALLDINNRDEAGRYELMQAGHNKAAFAQIGRTRWSAYPYSAILVLGAGPDIANSGIDGWGKMRLRLAVDRFRAGKAPFLIVSGGNVHPFQTPFNEAVEMKKVLMQQYQLPESAILIEPHARHTTTNLRNASRLVYRYGIPVEKPLLITSDMYQSRYIETPLFAERCQKELGYSCLKKLQRTSVFDLSFWPVLETLSANPDDPLDP